MIIDKTVGFIILRHINNISNSKHYLNSYNHIRKYYPENYIIIIDDNSDKNLIDKNVDNNLYKTMIIKSIYPGKGEVLPYYYYLHLKLFDIAVIIHDSVFINSYIDFSSVKEYKSIWDFEHYWDQIDDEINIIKNLNNSENLLKYHSDKNLWKGCFGAMTIITHDYLKKIDYIYNIKLLLDNIKNRYNRMSFERVIGCMLQFNGRYECLLGDIHKYCYWGIEYKDIEKIRHLPIIKIWCSR